MHIMTSGKAFFIVLLFILWTSCETPITVKEEDKVLHGGPVNSGFGGIYFGLYKDHKYQFCDGDFMDPGCYTGFYSLSGDTIILHNLKKHNGIPTNRFLIRRYKDMDSSYWQWKYPGDKRSWGYRRHSDSTQGATGDIVPLNQKGEMVLGQDDYFLIRFDEFKNNP